MPKLTNHCPQCGKQLVLEREILLDQANPTTSKKLCLYKCGHLFPKSLHKFSQQDLDLQSCDGTKQARPYQAEGVEFILNSGFNCIIGDQMRLGKTPQSLLALKNAYKEKTPCLILVRGANLWQWIREYKTWCDTLPNGIYPIVGGKAFIPPGFSSYIISMDTFSLAGTCKTCKHASGKHKDAKGKCQTAKCACKVFISAGDSMIERLKPLGFKCVIVDEAHSFKNSESNRSRALVNFVSAQEVYEDKKILVPFKCFYCSTEWEKEVTVRYDRFNPQASASFNHSSVCPTCNAHVGTAARKDLKQEERENRLGLILLTGTAIKNSAQEYFVPLNLVAPDKFSSQAQFIRQWLEPDAKGDYTRINRYRQEQFKQTIAPYVLRREKEDVFTDLPPLNRIFTLIEPPDKDKLALAYNNILDKMEEKLAHKANPSYWDMADHLMELRRICGLMKVMWASDYLEEALKDSDNQRYAVGIHHKAVRDVLAMKLYGQSLTLSGEDSAERKDSIMRRFEHSPERVLIINMLAGGVGMDFHYVPNVLILERQWSSADEEQFEFRFYNPDKKINAGSTNIEYIIAKGTIDSFFYDLVEQKRKIFGETISNNWSVTTDTGSFRDLVEQTVSARL